jgi:hypothetical protein
MRLCRTIALAITATAATAAALVPSGPASATAGDGLRASRVCEAAADGRAFPIVSRIHDAPPTVYRAGGGYRQWSLDLTNTTDTGCRALHPVLVLVDKGRELRSGQIRMEFHDGTRWRPVRFERTGQGDHVGVFDDGFPGFSVRPGRTVTVRARLAFTPDTVPGRVVTTAALVQRRGDDGDWVGESRDYAFDVVAAGDGDGVADGGGGGGRGRDEARDGDGPGRTVAGELAETGPNGALLGLGAAAIALLLGGGALMAAARRLRLRWSD